MTIDRLVLVLLWLLSAMLAFLFIPRRHIRVAVISFLACQALLWVSSLSLSQYKILEFPVREFPKATHLLVTTQYFFYPFLCCLYVVNEPVHRRTINWILLLSLTGAVVLIDVLLVSFTHLVHYERYTWYWNWIVFTGQFAAARAYCYWFFRYSESARPNGE
ncbi:CBO0543 family protein [Paenibacillus puerhi]|uniref:CBO0543 family protein n=1 Tax=Paenibacillus puerhi TaxID=2692622 RepID=UPI00135A10E3|nr:CBO0543 family protein [Paenibacillus puerhi]